MASVAPFVFVFVMWKILPESPRWLVTTGKTVEAEAIIRKAAKVNRTEVPKDLTERLQAMANKTSEKSYGYLSLFQSCTMATRTIVVCITQTASAFVYYQLVINIGNMAGNFYLNMFLMSLVEAPGSMVGVLLADKFGRRWTHVTLLMMNAIMFFIIMWLVQYPDLYIAVTFFCMWIKFNISGNYHLIE